MQIPVDARHPRSSEGLEQRVQRASERAHTRRVALEQVHERADDARERGAGLEELELLLRVGAQRGDPNAYLRDLYTESGQTLEGSFSAVSRPPIARVGAFFSIFRDLQNFHAFAPL